MKRLNSNIQAFAREDAGFTLVELLVVLGIIALLMTLVAPQVIRYLSDARSETASVQLKNIESALELYYLDTGQYPSSENGARVNRACASVQPMGRDSRNHCLDRHCY